MITLRRGCGLVLGLLVLQATVRAQDLVPVEPEKPNLLKKLLAQQPTPTTPTPPSTPTTPTQPRTGTGTGTGSQSGQNQPGSQQPSRDTAGSATDQSNNSATDVAPAGDIPNMMGDFPGRSGTRTVFVPRVTDRQIVTTIVQDNQGVPVIITTVRNETVVTNQAVTVRVPISSRAYKVAENESPRPGDRAYVMFNYFDDLYGAVNRRSGNVGVFDSQREGIGFEKTFFGGITSVGMRLPLNTVWNSSSIPDLEDNDPQLGNLTMIFKLAPMYDPMNADIIAAGVAVSLPTATGVSAPFNSTGIQPFVGWIYTMGDVFFQGFTSVDFPTDDGDVTLLFNDVGVGYYVFRSMNRDSFITAVAPTLEAHLNNPLNHRGAYDLSDPAGTPDWFSVTVGTTFQLYGRSTLAIGGNMPFTGPKPYDFEIMCQLNWYY